MNMRLGERDAEREYAAVCDGSTGHEEEDGYLSEDRGVEESEWKWGGDDFEDRQHAGDDKWFGGNQHAECHAPNGVARCVGGGREQATSTPASRWSEFEDHDAGGGGGGGGDSSDGGVGDERYVTVLPGPKRRRMEGGGASSEVRRRPAAKSGDGKSRNFEAVRHGEDREWGADKAPNDKLRMPLSSRCCGNRQLFPQLLFPHLPHSTPPHPASPYTPNPSFPLTLRPSIPLSPLRLAPAVLTWASCRQDLSAQGFGSGGGGKTGGGGGVSSGGGGSGGGGGQGSSWSRFS